MFDKHCRIEFMKHVLPTLRKPTNPRDAIDDDVTDDDVVSGELLCICSIQKVSISWPFLNGKLNYLKSIASLHIAEA